MQPDEPLRTGQRAGHGIDRQRGGVAGENRRRRQNGGQGVEQRDLGVEPLDDRLDRQRRAGGIGELPIDRFAAARQSRGIDVDDGHGVARAGGDLGDSRAHGPRTEHCYRCGWMNLHRA